MHTNKNLAHQENVSCSGKSRKLNRYLLQTQPVNRHTLSSYELRPQGNRPTGKEYDDGFQASDYYNRPQDNRCESFMCWSTFWCNFYHSGRLLCSAGRALCHGVCIASNSNFYVQDQLKVVLYRQGMGSFLLIVGTGMQHVLLQ